MYRLASPKSLPVVLIAALLLLTGCQNSQPPGQPREAAETKAAARPAPSPEAHILRDEARLRKPHAIIGGTVQNVGGERLENLFVEIELKRRADGATESREVSVEPGTLAPGEEGRYVLKVLSEEWGAFNVVRLRSGSREQDVAVKILPGAKRPPEEMPESRVIVVKTPRQKSKGKGDDFINTPDTPINVP